MDKMTIRSLIILAILGLLLFAPQAARAQTALQPTQLLVGAPAQSKLGTPLTVQAVLADAQGHPIPKAVIYFTTQETFLGGTSDMVLAQAVTNGKGQASAQFTDDFSGAMTLQAEFRGDDEYAPCKAVTQISAADSGQVYAEHIGVDIPGFNVPPVSDPKAALGSAGGLIGFIQNLWPAMNGWPVAAVLFAVWSTYLFAVRFVLRVAALGGEEKGSTSVDPGRQS
jgi:hypothetical protein